MVCALEKTPVTSFLEDSLDVNLSELIPLLAFKFRSVSLLSLLHTQYFQIPTLLFISFLSWIWFQPTSPLPSPSPSATGSPLHRRTPIISDLRRTILQRRPYSIGNTAAGAACNLPTLSPHHARSSSSPRGIAITTGSGVPLPAPYRAPWPVVSLPLCLPCYSVSSLSFCITHVYVVD